MIAKYTLKNGIPVFIVETHASPVVTIQAWINRGSVYETEKEAGISHFLEHSLFKGTRRRKVGQIASEIESRGGDINAFTSFEETCYYTTLASRYFSEGLDIIADAVQNPLFDAEEMAREKEVILEEIKRAYDSPHKTLSMNLWKEAFAGTPYSRPVLGYEATVRNINHKTLRTYFEKHYHAGSLSLFIVGDIDKTKALDLVKRQFSKMKSQKQHSIPKLVPTPFKNPKVIAVAKDVQESHVQLAWLAPSVTDSLIPAFDVMCSSIGQGESSGLFQRLVKEKKLAMDAQMGLVATARGGLATTGLSIAPENLDSALKETLDYLEEKANNGIEESELERVKSSLESEVISGKETVEGYARRLGYYFVQFGDPDYERKYLDSVLAVNKEQAIAALNQILK
ncbi:MAG: M16 family metallopeptidase, partial [Deltaproteobacteria bacterium]